MRVLAFCAFLACALVNAAPIKTAKLCRLSDYISAQKWHAAAKCAQQHGDFAKKLVQWAKYRAGDAESFAQIIDFVRGNPKWPDLSVLIANAERDVGPQDAAAIAWFQHHEPRTPEGAWFALRYLSLEPEKSAKLAKRVWVSLGGNEEWHSKFLSDYGSYLSEQDHIDKIRASALMGRNVPTWLISMVDMGWDDVLKSRKKLAAGSGNFLKLMDDVPRRLRNEPILLKAAAQWLIKNKEFRALNDLILDKPAPELLQDDWAKIRFLTASELVNDGEFELGYEIVSNHQFKDKVNEVDAHMMAGKIAYLHLNDPAKALNHFESMLSNAQMSISRSKAAYWCHLCALALNQDSSHFLETAALYPDNFYGQLALTKLGRPVIEIASPQTDAELGAKFKSSELIAVAKLLASEGRYELSRKFMLAVVLTYRQPEQLYQLAQFASASGMKSLAVIASKESARRGHFFVKGAYPVLSVPHISADLHALSLAIARQESEFHVHARSNKDALGLMQLIINTAREVARDLGLKRPSAQTLSSNPEMNVRLGSHHIAQLLERYSNCAPLAIAAYNAGPTPVDRWIQKNGDPSLMSPDEIVMWIEKIPFYETRSYVQHVLSNWTIYKNVLKGQVMRLDLGMSLRSLGENG